jgi:hypothetical protein
VPRDCQQIRITGIGRLTESVTDRMSGLIGTKVHKSTIPPQKWNGTRMGALADSIMNGIGHLRGKL